MKIYTSDESNNYYKFTLTFNFSHIFIHNFIKIIFEIFLAKQKLTNQLY